MEDNAAIVRAVLSGQRRDRWRPATLVVLNAAAALHVRTGDGLRECAERAQRAIDDGSAMHKLEALIAMSHALRDGRRQR